MYTTCYSYSMHLFILIIGYLESWLKYEMCYCFVFLFFFGQINFIILAFPRKPTGKGVLKIKGLDRNFYLWEIYDKAENIQWSTNIFWIQILLSKKTTTTKNSLLSTELFNISITHICPAKLVTALGYLLDVDIYRCSFNMEF